MARHVTPKYKAVSSGRLAGCGRGQIPRKKVTGRPQHPEPSFSLYSTDSEDQVTTINKGLDRCAALLSDILEVEKTDLKAKSQISTAASSKKKTYLGKTDTERKRTGRKASTVARVNKRPAPVQKTILPSQAFTGLRRQPGVQQPSAVNGSEANQKGNSMTQVACVQPHSFPPGSSLPTTGSQPSTVFNCRLTTSTPALSPHRPTSAHSQASLRGTDGETCHFTQHFSAAPSTQHGSLSATVSPTQYTASFTVAPASSNQLQPTVSTVAQLKPLSPVENALHACSGGQSSGLQSHGLQISPSPPASARLPTPAPLPNHIRSQEQRLLSGPCVSSSSEESGDCMSEEDELNRVDTMPVRDTSCQASIDKRTGILKYKGKPGSPEKTARKVMTVTYLLGELKALVANQDSEAVRLIDEVEQSISLLPAMVGSTNIQAELALALQPLRSENVQLRRRLRILNQQLQERERAERQARSVDCSLEVVSLQSLNLKLETQINEQQKELEKLQQENQKLCQALGDRDEELRQAKEQCKLESSRIRMDVSEALAEMQNCQAKLEDCEREKAALTDNLQQKETEITKLQEIIRNLQRSPIICHPAQTNVSGGSALAAPLTKSVLDQYANQQRVTDSVKTYLQTLEDSGHNSPPHTAHPQLYKLPHSSPGQFCTQENAPKSSDVQTSLMNANVGGINQEVDQDKITFVPLRETGGVQPAAASQKHTPGKGHVGLNYLDIAFNKLAISNSLSAPDDDDPGTDSLCHDNASLKLNQPSEAAVNPEQQSQHARRRLYIGEKASVCAGRPSAYEHSFLSCDIKSLASDWSVNTWSTFNTRDEQEFRNGLAALDASIASLQRTLKADLKR